MIYISIPAQKYLKKLLKDEEKGTHIRVFVVNPGTPKAECGVSYYSQKEIQDNDLEIKYTDFNVYVNISDIEFLKKTKIDLEIEGTNSNLTLSAPFAKYKQSKKNLSLKDRIQHFLDIEINPVLSLHGGQVFLIDITKLGYVILKFSGSCNGCSMIDVTLKEGIEKKLLQVFPEIKGITDLTIHQHGHHSYY
ncbi:NfuA family Fe-S biogenesis protein [Buchnera aphidicola]|uniref:NfuA family Fe-S biogenesis protein n=1 Tax=Buchnera aphidicola TaxID=9 RepID=UPI003463EB07